MIVAGTPTSTGYVERDDLRIHYQVYGKGPRAILLLPTWSLVHSDFWRHQVPHLAERYTVVVFDGLGNGQSDRPTDPDDYHDRLFAQDALAVLDAVGVDEAVALSVSRGANWNLVLAAEHGDRIPAAVFIGPAVPFGPGQEHRVASLAAFDDVLPTHEGWFTFNRDYWHRDWRGFLEFFFSQCFTEPDSDAQIEHFVGMGMQTSPEVIEATVDAPGISVVEGIALAESVRIPVLVIHGAADAITNVGKGRELARLTGGEFVERPGEGHEPQCRNPIATNAIIDGFLDRHYPPGALTGR